MSDGCAALACRLKDVLALFLLLSSASGEALEALTPCFVLNDFLLAGPVCLILGMCILQGGGGGQQFAHQNSKMKFLENKYAVWFYKSYQNEKKFLQL